MMNIIINCTIYKDRVSPAKRRNFLLLYYGPFELHVMRIQYFNNNNCGSVQKSILSGTLTFTDIFFGSG